MKLTADDLEKMAVGTLLWLNDERMGRSNPVEAVLKKRRTTDTLLIHHRGYGGQWEALPWSLTRNAPAEGGSHVTINPKIWLSRRD